jgi:hypothetical protein
VEDIPLKASLIKGHSWLTVYMTSCLDPIRGCQTTITIFLGLWAYYNFDRRVDHIFFLSEGDAIRASWGLCKRRRVKVVKTNADVLETHTLDGTILDAGGGVNHALEHVDDTLNQETVSL